MFAKPGEGRADLRVPPIDRMFEYNDGTAESRHVCASLLIASGASDVQVAHQMGHGKIETTKNIYGHLFAQDRAAILTAMNQAVTRLHVYETNGEGDNAAA